MKSVNKAILVGHLGKDAEARFTPTGIQVAQFTVATTRKWKDQHSAEWKEETDWHNCIRWRSENIINYLKKGQPVYLEGRLQTRSYQDKEGVKRYVTEVVVEDLSLLNRAPARAEGYSQPTGPASSPESSSGITDDDVPF
jgi:single-strand DNA-binding protein